MRGKSTSRIADFDEYPKVSREDMARAVRRRGLSPIRKSRVSILLDPAVIAFFKAKAGGRGYQTLINETLRESLKRENIVSTIRETIRQEFASAKK